MNKFKIGDKVYYPLMTNKVVTLTKPHELMPQNQLGFVIDGKYYEISKDGTSTEYDEFNPSIFHTTEENQKLLSKLYGKEFEKPPEALEGSKLTEKLLEGGWGCVPCWISGVSDSYARDVKCLRLVTGYKKDHNKSHSFMYQGMDEFWSYAVPFDPKTGQELTEEILDETI